jgi:hypothetical protein
MFVIVVYDANEKRVNKFLKTLRKYLTWVQNSVFEGEIEEAGLITGFEPSNISSARAWGWKRAALRLSSR